ncbi:MAG: AbrB/MazE/SpoVT family DNA-binding domain-containing protein [Deltaproteobacteria bacterium]|nr:AbrB/MazE/SpoVT family DNA-binding domain-containing protein [Deltaproteobacteria bacterium]
MNITTKGQVTIPKEIRDKYGLDEGVEVDFIDEEGIVKLIKKGTSSPIDKVYGILKSKERSDDVVEELRGR